MKVVDPTHSSTVLMWKKAVLSHTTTYNYTDAKAISFLLDSIQLIDSIDHVIDMIMMMYQMTTISKVARWFNYQISMASHAFDSTLFTSISSNPRSFLVEINALSPSDKLMVEDLMNLEFSTMKYMIQSMCNDDYDTSVAIVVLGIGGSIQKLLKMSRMLPQYILYRNGSLIVRLKSVEVLSALAKKHYTVRGVTIPQDIVTKLMVDWAPYIMMRHKYMEYINNIS